MSHLNESAERRTTTRSNAGVPPDRLGNPVPNDTVRRQRKNPSTLDITSNAEDKASNSANIQNIIDSSAGRTPENFVEQNNQSQQQPTVPPSVNSISGSVSHNEINDDAKTLWQITELEDAFDSIDEEIKITRVQQESIGDEIALLKEQLNIVEEDDKRGIQTQIFDLNLEMAKKKFAISSATIRLQTTQKKIDRRRKMLSAMEDNSEYNKDVEQERKNTSISSWIINGQKQTQADPSSDPVTVTTEEAMELRIKNHIDVAIARMLKSTTGIEEDTDPDLVDFNGEMLTKETAELLTRLEHMKNSTGPFAPEASNAQINTSSGNQHRQQSSTVRVPQQQQGNQNNNPHQDMISGMASIMSEVFRQAAPTSTGGSIDGTRTLLARQVQGRDLPIFSGAPEEWPAFISAYETTTRTCNYTDADNLSRLQKALKGEAKSMVQWLLINPQSVPEVIEDLKNRYGHPEVIITSLLSRAKEVPTVKFDKLPTFVEYGIAVRNLTATIQALNRPDHLSNPALLQELVKKLPPSKQMEWTKASMNYKDVTLSSFASWVKTETEVAYRLCPPAAPSTAAPEKKTRQRDRVQTATEAKESSKKKTSNQKVTGKCGYCRKEGHRAYDCSSFKSLNIEDKWTAVKERKLCFTCLNFGHQTKECRTKRSCGVDSCNKSHHRLLHNRKKPQDSQKKHEEVKAINSEELDTTATSEDSVESIKSAQQQSKTSSSGRVIVGILPILVRSPKGIFSTFAELDTGATITVMDEDFAKKLGLKGKTTRLTVDGFQSTTHHDSVNVEIEILKPSSTKSFKVNARTVPKLKLPSQTIKPKMLKKWAHLSDLNILTYDHAEPKMLIGLDNSQLLIPHEVRKGKGNSPFATKTALGWVLMGPVQDHCGKNFSCQLLQEENTDPLHQLVKFQFTTESLGIIPKSSKPRSREDGYAQTILDKTVRRIQDGWESGLLWKQKQPNLPDSKPNAFRRLLTMEKKMDKDKDFAKIYCNKIQEYLEKGYARVLSKEETLAPKSNCFYLPHFMATNPKKPGKYRFVLDAAARTNGSCLNDHLLQGPDKLTSLPGVLLKFRQRIIAMTGDIADMFHRVRVREEDACAQRFLWRGMDRDRDPDVLEMQVLIFGATCSPCCACEAKNQNALNLKDQFPEACEAIINRHYVDDYLDSCDTTDDSIRRWKEVTEVHSKGNFKICNWLSNSKELLSVIPPDLRSKSTKDSCLDEDGPLERVLGLFWKPSSDSFTFSLTFLKAKNEILSGLKTPTKREMLSLVMSLYDPLGLISILTVKARIILQSTWRTQIDWNDEIPPLLLDSWNKWLVELKRVPEFALSRCLSPHFSRSKDNQLHVFCDASEEAFGAVAYLRVSQADSVDTSLVMSRAKVSPIKALSIPRLELQAAVVAARLAAFINEEIEIKIHSTYFWTDSFSVLSWIRADSRRFLQFISHRVGEIQEITESIQWHWVPTDLNVADEMTRFDRPCDWSSNSRWIQGPDFLKKSKEHWPKEPIKKEVDLNLLELKPHQVLKLGDSNAAIDVNRFSSLQRLLRVTGYVLRIVRRQPGLSKSISVEEKNMAYQFWIRHCTEERETNSEIQPVSQTKSLSG